MTCFFKGNLYKRIVNSLLLKEAMANICIVMIVQVAAAGYQGQLCESDFWKSKGQYGKTIP